MNGSRSLPSNSIVFCTNRDTQSTGRIYYYEKTSKTLDEKWASRMYEEDSIKEPAT